MTRKRDFGGPATEPCDEIRGRDALLRELGFRRPLDYFISHYYRTIELAVLGGGPPCFVCGRQAKRVFFESYSRANLTGASKVGARAVCMPCAFYAEAKGGESVSKQARVLRARKRRIERRKGRRR